MKKYILFIFFLGLASGSSLVSAKMEPIYKDGRYYYSPEDTHTHISLLGALSKIVSPTAIAQKIAGLWGKQEPKSDPIELLKPTQIIPEASSVEPKIVWIGHSTFLVQVDGITILTDPIFGPVKAGPLTITPRAMPPGITLENIPPVDVILISHNHSDHMDTQALTYLSSKYQPDIYAPLGNGVLLKEMGFKKIHEKNWWEKISYTKESSGENSRIELTCLPAYHWSIRFSLGSYREALWSGWMIHSPQAPLHIYFAGDTAAGKHFQEIAEEFPVIDIALMPIGPTGECGHGHSHVHVDAAEAVDAFIDLNAHCFIPMHYGTFFLSKKTLEWPITVLEQYWKEKMPVLGNKKLLRAQCGQQYNLIDYIK